MKIQKTLDKNKLTLKPFGRIDTTTASELEMAVETDGVNELVFDLAEVDYISSAGLRVLLATQKKITLQGGKMFIANAKQMVMEIFDITGFTDLFTFI